MSDEPPQHLHLLSSFEARWDGLNLLYEIEPVDETPETYFGQHFIVIALDNFRASYMHSGNWQHVDYSKGDIAIFPATQPFPRTQIDRPVPLVELFLERATVARTVCEFVDADSIELAKHLHIRDPLIEHIGLALKVELESGGADSRLYAESMAAALSVHLLRRYSSRQPQIRNYTDGLPKYKLKEAIAYIHDHLDQNLTLAELSQLVYMSPHYFATLFKQSTGLTPHHYVTKCRIEKAKQLLAKHELSLVEISHSVGFQNQSHFTRVFRQYTLTTPKAYRDALHY